MRYLAAAAVVAALAVLSAAVVTRPPGDHGRAPGRAPAAAHSRPDVAAAAPAVAPGLRPAPARAVAPPVARRPVRVATPSPAVRTAELAAEAAWTDAEQRPGVAAWDAAAVAYDRAATLCGDGPPCASAAYAAVLARKHAYDLDDTTIPAGDAPVPLPERAAALVDALDRYVAADPGTDDAIGAEFLAGSVTYRYRHHDDAIERLRALLAHSGTAEVSEYAVNLVLDSLIRSDRVAELRALVAQLVAQPERFRRYPALWPRLQQLAATE